MSDYEFWHEYNFAKTIMLIEFLRPAEGESEDEAYADEIFM